MQASRAKGSKELAVPDHRKIERHFDKVPGPVEGRPGRHASGLYHPGHAVDALLDAVVRYAGVYLYLVRHAVAHKRDAERWPDDSERPLTPEGEEDFAGAARGLARIVPEVDIVLSSPYERAWRTAEILAEQTGWPAPQGFPALEPDVPPEKAVLALETYAGSHSIALAGHRPGLHELAVYLLTGEAGGADMKIKKGGVVCIAFDDAPEAGAGKLRWLFTPKVLRLSAVSD